MYSVSLNFVHCLQIYSCVEDRWQVPQIGGRKNWSCYTTFLKSSLISALRMQKGLS